MAIVLIASAYAPIAHAQLKTPAEGYAVERLYLAPAGGGWFVMDGLDMHGGLGGAVSLTTSYAMNPLRIGDGPQRLAVVSDQAFTDFGFAITYEWVRLALDLNVPIVISGDGGTVDGQSFAAPYHLDPGATTTVPVNLAATPDRIADPRIGFDARVLGEATSPFRLGISAQLFIPSGQRSEYDTDGTYRAMIRALVAGDSGSLTYAAHVGVHVRPLDDSSIPGSPRGSELVFGAAAGPKIPVGRRGATLLVIGPEFYGATAFESLLASSSTAIEGMLTGRLEDAHGGQPQLRLKIGTGGGIDQRFGAPEWRIAFGIELFERGTKGGPEERDRLR